MSEIIDMLTKGGGEIADLIRPLVEAQPVQKPAPAASGDTGAGLSGTGPEAPAAPEKSPVAPHRVVSLRLPAPSPLLPFEKGQRRASEQYRILRTKISQHPKQPRAIVVSSPAPGDGKSVSATNIAGALSLKSEGRVLLIDADLRKSAIHGQLGLPESPGLSDVLKGACSLDEAMVNVHEFPNLFVLTAGTPADNPVELLDSARWRDLAAMARNLFRYVIMDSPPVGSVADYDLIQAVCDGVILVIRPDHTNRLLCQRSLETVPKPRLLGVLINCVPDWSPGRRGGGDYYYYSGDKVYADQDRAR